MSILRSRDVLLAIPAVILLVVGACSSSDPEEAPAGASGAGASGAAAGAGGAAAGAGGAAAGAGGAAAGAGGAAAGAGGAAAGAGGAAAGAGGAAAGAGGATAGAGGTAGTAGGGGATLAKGKAWITAKISMAADGYNGSAADYASVEDKSTATMDNKGFGVTTGDGSTQIARFVNLGLAGTPAAGMTYTLTATGDDVIKGNLMNYQELTVSTVTTRSWICAGPVTIDAVVGTTYSFHFQGTCAKYGGAAVGTMTITGKGEGAI